MFRCLLCHRYFADAQCTNTVELDLGFKFAKKYVCKIYPDLGLSLKPLFLGSGVIDYRDNISVILTTFLSWNFDIKKGDKIARIIFLKKEEVDLEEVNEFDDNTVRGTKGFSLTDYSRVLNNRHPTPPAPLDC